MERLLRLAELWNWLPAFRAVAEHEHLPTAAAILRVSPSALSRSIRLLERSVGIPMFHREGGRLRLTNQGEEFLASLRESMRTLDDGLVRLSGPQLVGSVHIAIAGPYHSSIRSVALELRKKHPGLIPVLHVYDPKSVHIDLLRGKLDVVVTPDPTAHPRLIIKPIVKFEAGVYCGRKHPLYRAARVSFRELKRHPFVAPIAAESTPRADGWPPHLERTVSIYTMQLPLAVDLCTTGEFLATFPDVVAATLAKKQQLRKLPISIIPATQLFVVHRRPVSERNAIDEVIGILRTHWKAP